MRGWAPVVAHRMTWTTVVGSDSDEAIQQVATFPVVEMALGRGQEGVLLTVADLSDAAARAWADVVMSEGTPETWDVGRVLLTGGSAAVDRGAVLVLLSYNHTESPPDRNSSAFSGFSQGLESTTRTLVGALG